MTNDTETTKPKRKSFRLYAIASLVAALIGAGVATFATIAPATAASFTAAAVSLTQDIDAQIAVFVVPLALLLFAVIFEVTRFALRTALPVDAPPRARMPRHWQPGRGEG